MTYKWEQVLTSPELCVQDSLGISTTLAVHSLPLTHHRLFLPSLLLLTRWISTWVYSAIETFRFEKLALSLFAFVNFTCPHLHLKILGNTMGFSTWSTSKSAKGCHLICQQLLRATDWKTCKSTCVASLSSLHFRILSVLFHAVFGYVMKWLSRKSPPLEWKLSHLRHDSNSCSNKTYLSSQGRSGHIMPTPYKPTSPPSPSVRLPSSSPQNSEANSRPSQPQPWSLKFSPFSCSPYLP